MELLAHIAAPTSKNGDELYKAQLLAYLEFNPVGAVLSSEPSIHGREDQTPRATSNGGEQNVTTLVEASFSWKSPFQQLEDVRIHHTDISPSVERPAKRRRLTPEFSVGIESFRSISTVEDSEGSSTVSRIPATQPAQAIHTPSPAEPSSLLPDTYSLSKSASSGMTDSVAKNAGNVTSDELLVTGQDRCEADARNASRNPESGTRRHTLKLGSQVIVIDHGVLLNVGLPREERSDTLSDDSSGVKPLYSLPVTGQDNRRSNANLDSNKVLPNTSAVRSEPTSSQLHELLLLPGEIWPPPPGVDSLDWHSNKSHVTQDLLSLEPIIDPAKRYKPVSQTRLLAAWERGCWHIDTDSWPLGTQINFWNMLEKTIRRGAAGYATWCEMTGKRGSDGSLIGLGRVKVWCWGDEVMHMYLLLYTTSLRKVANVGAQWRSWNGEVVVQMKDDRHRN